MRLTALLGFLLCAAVAGAEDALHPPIGIPFKLDRPGFVTLVIEDEHGVRVRNLVSETPYPAGDNTAWWDGTDDIGRDLDAAAHSVYHVPGQLVAAGRYRVRGLVRPAIDVTYQMTPYYPGNPPWQTADRASGWLANHSPASDVLFLPPGEAPLRKGQTQSPPQVLVGSRVSEGGSGLAWVGLDGKKLHGQEWLGGVWTGAQFLARDVGPKPVEGLYAYTVAYWEGDKFNNNQSELRLHGLRRQVAGDKAPKDKRFGTGEDFAVLKPTYKLSVAPKDAGRPRLGGLAAYNGVLAVSIPANDEILFVDAAKSVVIGTMKHEGVAGIAYDAEGQLFAITGKTVRRLQPSPGTPGEGSGGEASTGEGLIATHLDDPQDLAIDDNGDVYVSDWGDSHQVKVFDKQGKFLRAIGQPGKPTNGPYNPNHMNRPLGMAITSDRKLWVAENDSLPKRLSVWSLDGRLERAYYGPPPYGSGGAIDPADKTRFFMTGMELKLDWATGENHPVAVFGRREADDPLKVLRGDNHTTPQWPVHVGDRTYLVDSYNVNPTQGVSVSGVWKYADGRISPAALVGQANELPAFNPTRSFSARWTGQITVPQSGEWTFFSTSTHGSRLWIDGKTVTSNWRKWGQEAGGKITLEAGKYDFTMEIYNDTGPARAILAWQHAGTKKATVPAGSLSGVKGVYYSDRNLKDEVETRDEKQIDFNWGTAGLKFPQTEALRRRLPQGVDLNKDNVVFAWSDRNDDGRVQPEEITTARGNAISICFQNDLGAVTGTGAVLKPRQFTAGGTPVYEASDLQPLIDPSTAQGPTSSGGGQGLVDSKGTLILTTAPKPFAPQSLGGKDWSYPSLWPGLHASHIAPLPGEPGMLIGTTRLLGPTFKLGGEELFGINGNKGVVYLFTTDGLFVATLFKDIRQSSWNFPQAVRGMSVKDASLHEETFYTTITATQAGELYVQGQGHLLKVEGVEQVKRLPHQTLMISAEQLAEAQRYFVEREAARQAEAAAAGKTDAVIPITTDAPQVDGKLVDWNGAAWLTIDTRTVQVGDWGKRKLTTAASVRVAGDRLYLAVKTDRADLLNNTGETPNNLFKTGGGIEVQLVSPTAGEQRVLVAMVNGKPLAMRYRAKGPGEPVQFSSPVRSVTLQSVENVTQGIDLASAVERDEKNTIKEATYELSIPLATLDLKPADGLAVRADVGVLRGNDFRTTQRACWANKATGLGQDLPSEAELLPKLWGTWTFKAR